MHREAIPNNSIAIDDVTPDEFEDAVKKEARVSILARL